MKVKSGNIAPDNEDETYDQDISNQAKQLLGF